MTVSDRIERAWKLIDERRLLATAQDLIRIPSVNPLGRAAEAGEGEEEVSEYVADRCRRLGMAPEIRRHAPRRASVIAELGDADGDGFRLMLCGHLDTVQAEGVADPFGARAEDGVLHGRGACDMKEAVACFVEVLEVLRALGAPRAGRLVLCATADEEFGMTGARTVAEDGPAVDAAIVGEPTGLRLCTAARGRVSLPLTTTGRAAHTSAPETGVNAVTHMGHLLVALDAHAARLARDTPAHPLLGTPRLAAGPIHGGVQVNQVPDHCTLEVDRRTLPGETVEDVHRELRSVVSATQERVAGLQCELGDPTWLVPASETETDGSVAQALAAALAALELDPAPTGFPGGSDAPFLGAPAVICGPGDLGRAHSIEEQIAIADLRTATRVYLHAGLTLLEGSS